jgi:transposase
MVIKIQEEADMSKQAVWAGMDVGKDEVWVSAGGAKVRRFDATASGIREACCFVTERGGSEVLRVCMESTGVYSYRVALWCREYGMTVAMVNPAQIAAFAKAQLRRTKTDRVDAEVIRCFAESQQPRRWEPVRPSLRRLCGLVTELDRLREMKQQLANRDHSHDHIPDLPREVRSAQRAIHRSLDRQIKKLEEAVAGVLAEDQQMNSQVTLLSTIPGVKMRTAVRLLAYGKDLWAERTPKELTAHVGLAPKEHQSGSSIRRKSRLAKQGDGRLRNVLYMPAMCGIVHNPYLRPHYQRLVADGKPKLLALAACMRKLLLLIRAMLTTNQPFIAPKIALT